MKYLAVFSTLANCLTAVSFGIIFYFIFREPIQTENRRLYGPIDEFPLFIGIVLFSLESVGIVIYLLYNAMMIFFSHKNQIAIDYYCIVVGYATGK